MATDKEKVESMFNKYEGGSDYKVKKTSEEPQVGSFKFTNKNPKELLAIMSKEGYSTMTQEDLYQNLKELYEPKNDK